jgi:hypothetical protein
MSGPVAQLGARFHGMEEVIGSIPIRSTKQPLTNQIATASSRPPSMSGLASIDAAGLCRVCPARSHRTAQNPLAVVIRVQEPSDLICEDEVVR